MSLLDTEKFEELEALLRAGQYPQVREYLRDLNRNDVPDSLILRVSRLARRIDYAQKGVILLRDRVVELPAFQIANPLEVVEYAGCLIKLGGVTEASKILQQVHPTKTPEALKYLAFCHFHVWNYEAAIPLLKHYLAIADLNPYDRLVGHLNLAAALVSVKNCNEAFEMLNELCEKARSQGHTLILGNSYEIRAQAHILLRNFTSASQDLRFAWEALKQAPPRYRLYLEKWNAVNLLTQNAENSTALKSLRKTRDAAYDMGEWEVTRECDFYEARATQNQELYSYLYCGTPFDHFRKKLRDSEFCWAKIPLSFLSIFKKGHGMQNLLGVLSSDFYRPVSVIELFCQLFPAEHFNPVTSPARIHQLVRRLKLELKQHGFSIALQATKGGYSLAPTDDRCALLVEGDRTQTFNLVAEISKNFSRDEFKLVELVEKVGIPHTTLYREIKTLVEDGKVIVMGTGKKTVYRLAG